MFFQFRHNQIQEIIVKISNTSHKIFEFREISFFMFSSSFFLSVFAQNLQCLMLQ